MSISGVILSLHWQISRVLKQTQTTQFSSLKSVCSRVESWGHLTAMNHLDFQQSLSKLSSGRAAGANEQMTHETPLEGLSFKRHHYTPPDFFYSI